MKVLPDLPRTGPQREALREKGQFWTPPWVAEAMVSYVLRARPETLFDPAVGAGAFFQAAKKLAPELGYLPLLVGSEIDPTTLDQALASGLTPSDLAGVQLRDFLLDPPDGPFPAIVGNPPYIRHHRLPPVLKGQLRLLSRSLLGRPLDGRTGLHTYFLLRALRLLHPQCGRLAFILPADAFEGISAPFVWRWVTEHYCLDCVITFEPEASPFPDVDVNPVIVLIRAGQPHRRFYWVRCLQPKSIELRRWILADFQYQPLKELSVQVRELSEALATGLSRPPRRDASCSLTLLDFATVVRGIATGANEFFLLTRRQAQSLGIPPEFLVPAIGRTRDVPGNIVDYALLDRLDSIGRPTLLFCPDGRPLYRFPDAVRRYIAEGERRGIPQRPLIATRRPWYKMETRKPPAFLFAYLGRRNARFIRNLAGVVPLTGFLCVYPRSEERPFVEALWQVLTSEDVIRNLAIVGKSYGSGCIKVEPRALERLPIPSRIIRLLPSGLQTAFSSAAVQEVLPY